MNCSILIFNLLHELGFFYYSGENSGASSPRNPESGFSSANVTPKKLPKSRKRNSSTLSVDGQTAGRLLVMDHGKKT